MSSENYMQGKEKIPVTIRVITKSIEVSPNSAAVEQPKARLAHVGLPLSASVMWQSRIFRMVRHYQLLVALLLSLLPWNSSATNETRVLVELPQMMQEHMMSNMRDHLAAINEILMYLGQGEVEKAAETAEYRLGMSSLKSHGASHMARFMPEKMRSIGTGMHRAASRFALIAQEGDAIAAYQALPKVTSACVACHAGFKIR